MGQARTTSFCGILLAAALPWAAAAQAPEPQQNLAAAQARVLVLVESDGHGPDSVSLQFAGDVKQEELHALVARAAQSGGWQPGPQTRESGFFVPGKLWEQMTGRKAEPQPRTLARFQAPGLVDRAAGRLAVREFLEALAGYSPVRVVYKVKGEFAFAWPEPKDLGGWRVELQHADGTYTYDALAARAPRAAVRRAPPAETGGGGGRLLLAMLCFGAAAATVGAGAWFWFGRDAIKKRIRGDGSGSGP